MRAYMRDQFEYFGITSPIRKAAQSEVIAEYGYPDDLLAQCEFLWTQKQRECQYVACDMLTSVAKSKKYSHLFEPVSKNIDRVEQLIITKSWWDTVDCLAPRIAWSMLTRTGPTALRKRAEKWIASDNIWLQRSAIILQLHAKQQTDVDLLTEVILHRASSTEFFVRKGAGWALREYSKVDPKAVRRFIDKHSNVLSGLTIREGSKYC